MELEAQVQLLCLGELLFPRILVTIASGAISACPEFWPQGQLFLKGPQSPALPMPVSMCSVSLQDFPAAPL